MCLNLVLPRAGDALALGSLRSRSPQALPSALGQLWRKSRGGLVPGHFFDALISPQGICDRLHGLSALLVVVPRQLHTVMAHCRCL